MLKKRPAIKNLILDALPPKDYARLLADLEAVPLPLGEILYRSGDVIEHVYFPEDGLVSLVTHMNNGTTVEVGIIGRDGMVGIPVLLGGDIAFEEAIVQIAGSATRLRAGDLKEALKKNHSPLLTHLLLYTRSLMKQVGRTAACNRIHTVEERLARWLLMCHDRVESDELALTQEFISNMLGTRRASVGSAAIGLQAEGLIRYSRGHVTVTDRSGLEEATCECYGAGK